MKKYIALFLWSSFALAEPAAGFSAMQSYFQTYLVDPFSAVLFFNVAFFTESVNLPFVLVWLMSGALFLTFKMSFINFRGFKHAINVTLGKYDHKSDPGELSHFQALSSALSATVGLGNITGVAIAVGLGGPGAVFWIIVAGLFGMTAKFTECTLAVKYRAINEDGQVLGGPMRYLSQGFKNKGYPRFGKFLASVFCIMCIGGSLGGGNMFQSNQAYAALSSVIPSLQNAAWLFGLLISFAVGLVIIGGIKRIGHAASIIVPFMCLIYLLCGIWILATNIGAIPQAMEAIWNGAFTPEAGYGGMIGVLIIGFRRAAFSNEAGIGSAAIAHSAVATKEPVREGIVALLEPFIDTVVICTMTGLMVVVTGAYKSGAGDGVLMTSEAFRTVADWMPALLSIVVLLFAYSTMISWSYYGERSWAYLFKTKNTMPFKFLFVTCTFLGSVFSLGPVLEFSDLMILGMAVPNILGIVVFSSEVKRDLEDYWRRYLEGEFADDKVKAVQEESIV
jgi:AGCS family alanine or glycine:cation symporter